MRPWCGFGMVLHAEHRVTAVPEAFERFIVQIHVREVDVGRIQRIAIHREPVIVRGDLDPLRDLVQHRMIGAAVAELQLVGLAAERQAEKLMPQADAEDRNLSHELADIAPPAFRAVPDRPARSRETRHPASARARLRPKSARALPSCGSQPAPAAAECSA